MTSNDDPNASNGSDIYRLKATGGDMPGSMRLTFYLSLNYLAVNSLQQGSNLRLRMLQERVKVF